jgi:hypothetical protein
MLPGGLRIVVLLVLPLGASVQQITTTEIAGRSVEMVLVKAEDLTLANFVQTRLKLTQAATKLGNGSNVLIRLRESGIAPDSEALTLVYDLNATVRDLNEISADQPIMLPVVQGDKESQELLKKGYLIELTVDPEIRQRLNSRIDSLQQLLPSVPAVTTDPTTQKHLTDTIEWFGQIEKRCFRCRTRQFSSTRRCVEQFSDKDCSRQPRAIRSGRSLRI